MDFNRLIIGTFRLPVRGGRTIKVVHGVWVGLPGFPGLSGATPHFGLLSWNNRILFRDTECPGSRAFCICALTTFSH